MGAPLDIMVGISERQLSGPRSPFAAVDLVVRMPHRSQAAAAPAAAAATAATVRGAGGFR